MNRRSLAEPVVLNIGGQLGILSANLFAVVVFMTFATTALTVSLVKLFQRTDVKVEYTASWRVATL